MGRLVLAAALVVATAAFIACSSSAKNEEASTTSDAGQDTKPFVGLDLIADFTCLGKVKYPTPASSTVAFDFATYDPTNAKPIADVKLKACAFADTDCASPLDTATTGAKGFGTFEKLPVGANGFDGFFEAQYENERPNLNFQQPIWAKFPSYGRNYWGDAQMQTVLDSANVKLEKGRALVGFQVHDCRESPNGFPCNDTATETTCKGYLPGGIVVTIDVDDPKIQRGYIHYEDGRGNLSLTDEATSGAVGLGGFINVPPGPVTLTATIGATGQKLGTYKAFARADAYSMLVLMPQ